MKINKDFNEAIPDIGVSALPLVGSIVNGADSGELGTNIGGTLGTAAGALLGGPVGAKVGQVAGSLIGGLIGKSSAEKKKQARLKQTALRTNNALNITANDNPYGDVVSFYAEDGGMPAMAMEPQDEFMPVNIELNELVVDPQSFKIIQDFSNNVRFSKHAKNKLKEPAGNFVDIPATSIVIPAKLADRYKKGGKLTRKSIVGEILKNQIVEQDFDDQYQTGGSPKVSQGFGNLRGKNVTTGKRTTVAAAGKGGGIKSKKPVALTDLKLGSNAATVKPVGMIQPLALPSEIPTTTLAKNPPVKLASILPKMPAGYDLNIDDGLPIEAPVMQAATARSPFADLAIDDAGTEDVVPAQAGFELTPMKAARALNFLPTLVGLGDAFSQDPNLLYTDNAQYNEARGAINAMPVDINTQAEEAAIARNSAGFRQMMRNYGSPSVRAEIASMYANNQNQIGQIKANARNMRNQLIASKLGMIAGLSEREGANKEQARVRFNTESSQDRAVRSGMIQAGISEAVGNYGKMVMDDERIKSVNAMSNYFKLNPGAKEILASDPNAMELIINQITGGYVPNLQTSGTGKGTQITTKEESVSRDRLGRVRTSTSKNRNTTVKKN